MPESVMATVFPQRDQGHPPKHRMSTDATPGISRRRASSARRQPTNSLSPSAVEHDAKLLPDGRYGPRLDVLGYPATWPAGPWIVPLFWLMALHGAWLLQWLG
jgi:hypothetical protein